MNSSVAYHRWYNRSRRQGWRDAKGRVVVVFRDLMTRPWRVA